MKKVEVTLLIQTKAEEVISVRTATSPAKIGTGIMKQ